MRKFNVLKVSVFYFSILLHLSLYAQNTDVSEKIEKDTTLIRLEKVLSQTNDPIAKVDALADIGLYQIDRDFRNAEGYLQQALAIIVENPATDFRKQRGILYDHLGVVRRREANYSEAIAYYLKAKEIFEKTQDSLHLASTLHNMGVAYRFLRKYPESIDHLKKALLIKKALKEPREEALTNNMLGVSFRQNKQLDSALLHYQRAEQLFKVAGSEDDVKQVKGNIATLFYVQEKYHKSLKLYLEVLEDNKAEGDKIAMARTYNSIGRNYRKLKQYELSIKFLDSSLELAKELGLKNRLALAYRSKANVSRALGDFESAYRSYVQYKRYNDSLLDQANIERVRELELRYEFRKERLRDSLELVRERALTNSNIQILESKNRVKNQWIIFGGLGLLAIFAISYLVRSRLFYRKKQQLQTQFSQNLIVEREQERRHLARELHDSVGQKLMLLTKKVKTVGNPEMEDLASDTLAELRTISRGLHPAALEQLGVSAAMVTLINEIDANTNIFFTHDIAIIDHLVTKKTALHLYRMVQEILSNMVKHAHAKAASVTVESQGNEIRFSIKDNGSGFNVQEALRKSTSLGFRTLLERAGILKAQLHIDSELDKGTHITINLPIDHE